MLNPKNVPNLPLKDISTLIYSNGIRYGTPNIVYTAYNIGTMHLDLLCAAERLGHIFPL